MKKILMTSPTNFSVQYEINPWMDGNVGGIDKVKAVQQWSMLRNALASIGADVIVLPPSPEYCPDAVFTANAGLLYKDSFLPSVFKHEERAVEEPYFINWFLAHDFKIDSMGSGHRDICSFEGAGDALFNSDRSSLWYGFGFRSSITFRQYLDAFFAETDVIIRPLELVNPNFYHLDTCFCPLDTGELLWYPKAFSEYSQMIIRSWYEGKSIEVGDEDAMNFVCNAVSVGNKLVVPKISDELLIQLTRQDYSVIQCDMSEFIKSGGACKCLTLEVIE